MCFESFFARFLPSNNTLLAKCVENNTLLAKCVKKQHIVGKVCKNNTLLEKCVKNNTLLAKCVKSVMCVNVCQGVVTLSSVNLILAWVFAKRSS